MKRVLCALKNLIKKIKNEKKDEPKIHQNVLCNLNYILKQIEKLSPCCNMKKLSCETDGFTKINGQSVPGTLAPLRRAQREVKKFANTAEFDKPTDKERNSQ